MYVTVFTVIGIIFSILVVSTSTVFSVLWLVGTFIIISLMLALLNLGFPALIYVIVYIGAIAILFLFVIQLLDSENSTDVSREQPLGPLAFLFSLGMMTIGVVLSNVYTQGINLHSLISYSSFNESQSGILGNLFFKEDNILLNYFNLTAKTGVSTQVESFAEWLYGPGLLPLIVVSVVLLVAMIAPIYLCKES